MGRFSKRAYRQGHQTLEFFGHQPTLDQDSSEASATLGTSPPSGNSHRAVVKGAVQNCSGAEKCPDCIAGRSAPVQNDGSTSLPRK
jgi:hypothetical protein